MCQYSSIDGVVGDWHQVHLGAFATGGAGLIMAEATGVTPEGRISVACPGIWNDGQVEAWSAITRFAHVQGSRIGLQLAHAGRKSSTLRPWDDHLVATPLEGGWTPQGPSDIPFEGYPVPHSLSVSEIDNVVTAFASGAARALRAGFDVVEIHAAHGYLLHQFLSPLSNVRPDAYGGDFDGRTKLVVQVVDAVREAIPDHMPLMVRISATDYVPGGWDLEQSIRLCSVLRSHGVDLFDVSSGGNVHGVRIPLGPGYQVGFAESIRREVGSPVSAVGLITDPAHAEGIVASGQADAVMLARAFLRSPRWALNAAEALGVTMPWPVQFERARTLHR